MKISTKVHSFVFKYDALVVTALSFALYVGTLSPTVLWGDEGHLQLSAVEGTLQGSAGSHPLWVLVAHQFTKLPIGDAAGRVNFVSALFGAVTVGLVYMTLRQLRMERMPSLLAVGSLAIAHTFWSYSVRAEVYTMTLACMALQIWLGLRWYDTGDYWLLLGLAFVTGVGLSIHLMTLLYGPALLWLVWRNRENLPARDLLVAILVFLLGASPLVGLVIRDARVKNLRGIQEILQWALFSFEGYDFSGAFFDFSWRLLPSDLFEWAFFLALQFLGMASVAGVLGCVSSWRRFGATVGVFLALLYTGAMAFAFAYRVGDRYVFYLPSYLPVIVWIASGFRSVLCYVNKRFPSRCRLGYLLLVVVIIAVPILIYRLGPELVARGVTFRDTRHMPGPRGRYFFLWPPKSGYDDPRVFAENVLAAAPPGSVLWADPTLAAPLRFLHDVEAIRQDVKIMYCCWDLKERLPLLEGRPSALVDLSPRVYPVEWLDAQYEIRPYGPIYLLSED